MRIVIAGGHGKIARLLARQLADAGHEPIGLIRNPDHCDSLIEAGATPVVLDLENTDVDEVAAVLERADAVVFAAGAGPNSGPERKLTIDRDGAILFADAAVAAGVRRFVIVSSMNADNYDPDSDDEFQIYLHAKGDADAAVRTRDLDWTIVRPGALIDTAATGLVSIGDKIERGSIPRADVAAVIVRLLENELSVGRQFDLTSGNVPIGEALSA